MNTIVSPIPTRVYKPAMVMPRQTSAMTLSGWGLICLSGTALPLDYFPTHIDHARGGELFRFQGPKAHGRKKGTSQSRDRARHRLPAIERRLLEQAAMFLSPTSASTPGVGKLKTALLYREMVSRRVPHGWPRQNVHPPTAFRHI